LRDTAPHDTLSPVADDANKTTATDASVSGFIDNVADEQRRNDARLLVGLMQEATGQQPVMWGSGIVGFGIRHYRYASGREGDFPPVSFAPRKAQTALYLTGGLDKFEDLLARLGPHSTGKGCLYLKRVDQADAGVLRDLVARSYRLAAEG
jgi:hypothetical protein